jgi:hypothetical protein
VYSATPSTISGSQFDSVSSKPTGGMAISAHST